MAIVVCPVCGTKNRVDDRAVDRQPICGKCGAKLPAAGQSLTGKPVAVTDQTFDRDVIRAEAIPVLVDCWAPWCGPCRMIAPALEQLAAESGGRYIIAKLNTDENPQIAARYRIEAIPTLLLFKAGQLVERMEGLRPKEALAAKLKQYL